MLAKHIQDKLAALIPEPSSELNYTNKYELLVAVILSAQCTDKRVNIVTKHLFAKYPTIQSLAEADVQAVEEIIKSCNYYKSKAKNIVNACKKIMQNYNGQVPDSLHSLTTLDGVGRKTANVILAVGFDVPAIAVDTHVFRVANRLGLTNAKNVIESELQLQKAIKKENWISMHHYLILFGRYYCKAMAPLCEGCVLRDKCLKINGHPDIK